MIKKKLPPLFTKCTTDLRGHSKELFATRAKKDIGKYHFTNRVVTIWNDLPENVVKSKTIEDFERALDDYWADQKLKYDNPLADIKLRNKPDRLDL